MPLSAACYPWHLWLCMVVLSVAPFVFFYGLIWTSYHLHHQCSFMASYGLLISCAFGCPDILLLSLVLPMRCIQAVSALVQHAMQYINDTPDLETRIELIETLSNVSAGKVCVLDP
jgi:hypothetical protein